MKTTGWILALIGVLTFIGASSHGHSVFGPCFWGTLGIFLIYKAKNKDK